MNTEDIRREVSTFAKYKTSPGRTEKQKGRKPKLSTLQRVITVCSERVAVHAVPVGIGGEAEGAVGGLAAAAATEKTAKKT